MALHELAQSVTWFNGFLIVEIGLILWYDMHREAKKHAQK